MKKILLLIGMTTFTFALNVNLYTCGASVNGNEVTFDVCMDSDDAVDILSELSDEKKEKVISLIKM